MCLSTYLISEEKSRVLNIIFTLKINNVQHPAFRTMDICQIKVCSCFKTVYIRRLHLMFSKQSPPPRCGSTPTSRWPRWRSCGAASVRCTSPPSPTPTLRPPEPSPALPPMGALGSGFQGTYYRRVPCSNGCKKVVRRRTWRSVCWKTAE